MEVEREARVLGAVGSGEVDGRRLGGAIALHRELVARHVELRGLRVQGDDLAAEEVVTRRDILGDLHVNLAAARVHVLDAPEVVVGGAPSRLGRPAILVDLEPACGAIGRRRVGYLGEVRDDGAVMLSSDCFAAASAGAALL